MPVDAAGDPYTWDGRFGWRKYRALCLGRGMYHDVRRRLPYYWSDIKDGINYRTFAATVRMYFVNLLPALAFISDMNHNTGGFYGVNEALFSSALAAMVFSTLACQPITIVGITGLISLFNYTIYDIIKDHDVTLYPRFMVWVGIWAAVWHWGVAFMNLVDYMRTVTDYSANTFALYVGTIYLIKGVETISVGFYFDRPVNGFASAMVAILYAITVYLLERIGRTTMFRPRFRKLLSDYAYPIATIFWVGFTHIPGNLDRVNFVRLTHTRAFYPTTKRGWLIDFWNLPVKWVFVAFPIGGLMMLLFYYDHNLSSLTAQQRRFPLKKPAGFHWDFFLLGCTCFIAGILGLPLPNGLVPQAPVHTDALTEYEDRLDIKTTTDGDELRTKAVVESYVVEQRISHFVMGLAIIGTMTGPLLVVLHTMPHAVFAGVFFVVGWGSIEGNGIVRKLIYLLKEPRFVRRDEPLLGVPKHRILFFVSWQLLTWAMAVSISQTIAAIGFPVIITALIPFRWLVIPKMFSVEELQVMDSLTATNDVVLVSFGGKPEMPEVALAMANSEDETAVGSLRSSPGSMSRERDLEAEFEGPEQMGEKKEQQRSEKKE